ncbi:MAG: hypothetical protein FWF00_06995, partial [Endomicrobia bacterium]|nr:hypothetical protein [Endomicrobiia bacterium]
VLITVATSEFKGKLVDMFNQEELSANDIGVISSQLIISKAVNMNVMIEGLAQYISPVVSETKVKEERSLAEALSDFKNAVEKKQTMKEKFVDYFTSQRIIDDALPAFDAREEIKKGKRGIAMSPLMARAVAQSA